MARQRLPGEPIPSDALVGQERWTAEHQLGLHATSRPPVCPVCWPAGPPESSPSATNADAPRPRPAPAHRFVGSLAFEAGEPLCICGASRSAHNRPTLAPGSLQAALARLRATVTVDQAAPEPEPAPLAPDGGPWCGRCRGARWLRRDVDKAHPEFGQAIPCPDCAEGFVLQQRLDRLWGQMPEIFRGASLDSFPATHTAQAQLVQHLREWLDDPCQPWAYFWGETGRGKSTLAAALLYETVRRGGSGTFMLVNDLLGRLRSSYGMRDPGRADEAELLASLQAPELVVLDDIGRERHRLDEAMDWSSEILFRVVNSRHDARKRTILTSNLDLDALTDLLGSPTTTRIGAMTDGGRWVIEFPQYLPDLRLGPARARALTMVKGGRG